MEKSDPIFLTYTPKGTGHVRDSLYHMMTGDIVNKEWEIDRNRMSELGFELANDSVSATSVIPSVATFHHYPSGSTVVVEDRCPDPVVKIFGKRNTVAKDSLVSLVRPYEFELKETRRHSDFFMA